MALMLTPVEDPADPRLADYLDLRDPGRRRQRDEDTGVFVVEGWKAVDRLLASSLVTRSVVVTAPKAARAAVDLGQPVSDVPLYVVAPDVLEGVAGFTVHRGVLAVAERPPPLPWQAVAGDARRLLVVEAVNDQENLGSLFRTAAGLGADGVLLCPRACDPLYRRTVRVSVGASFLLPWARLEPWPDALGELRDAGWVVAALSPDANADLGTAAASLQAAERLALMVGSEGDGLTDAALAAASTRLSIPMAGGTDSLNVHVAAAIALWAARPN